MGHLQFATRATSAVSGIQIQASVELMDDYVFATDLTGASDISVARTATGSNRIFYMSASGAMSLFQDPASLFQDPASDTGWSEEALSQPDNGLTAVCGAQGSDGIAIAFGISANTAAPDVYMTRRGAGGTWAAWTLIPPSAAVPAFFYAKAIDAMVVGGVVNLFAILAPSPGQSGGGNQGLWTVGWQADQPLWTKLADTDQLVLEPCTIAGAGLGVLYGHSNGANPNLVDLFQLPAPFDGAPSTLAAAVSFTDIAVGLGASGNSMVAIADNGYQSGSVAISALDCSNVQAGFVPLDRTIVATALCVTDAGDTPAAIFALDANSLLNLIDNDGAGNWQAAFNMQLLCSSLTAATDVQGQGELYAWMGGKGLHRNWRSPRPPGDGIAGPGPWRQEPVQYDPVNQSLTQQTTYATALTFYDANGAVMPNQAITLRASEIISANVGGNVLVLGPDNDTICTTDAAGRIRLTTPTDSVSTAQISASVPGLMDALEDFAITPNAKAQKRLSVISQADLLKFLNPQYANDVAQVQQAVQSAMTAVQPSDGWRTVRARPNGAHVHRTPLRTEGMQAFRLDVGRGKATYTALSPAEAGAAIAAFNIGPRHSVDGFFDFFEDVVEAIGDAVESAIDFVGTYIIAPIGKALSVALKFVIGGITYAVQAVIDTVEQAFEAVESVFNSVLTFFKDLYNFLAWLLGDALKDIRATKSFFQNQLRAGVSQLATLAAQGAGVSATFFATIETAIANAFGQVEAQLSGINLDTAINARSGTGDADDADDAADTFMDLMEGMASPATWLRDKIEDALFGAGINIDLPAKMIADFTSLMGEMTGIVTDALQSAIDRFIQSLKAFASSSASFGAMALATLVDAVKQVILLVLKVIDQIVQKFLTLISTYLVPATTAIFGASISNFLIEAVYDLLKDPDDDEPMTVAGLLCLFCAFPTTILYRAVTGNAPFSDRDLTAAEVKSRHMILSGCMGAGCWLATDLFADMGVAETTAAKGLILNALWIVPALMNWMAQPATAVPPETQLEKARFTGWIMGFSGPATVLCWALATNFTDGPRSQLAGQGVLCMLGLATLSVNIWQMAIADDLIPADYAVLIGGPISDLAKPLKSAKSPMSKVALGIADVASDACLGGGRIKKGVG